jgi:hypothetical protein
MVSSNFDVPVGEWIDVPKGMLAAPDTYVDRDGVLRDSRDHSCVVWHIKGCAKRSIHPSEIVYDPDTKAPWCPKCWPTREKLNTMEKIKTLFQGDLSRGTK